MATVVPNPKTVMAVIGTRPEAVKLAPIVLAMRSNRHGITPFVCVTGQHREMLQQVLGWFGIIPDCDLCLMREGQGLAEFAGRALSSLDGVLKEVRPDTVLVQGDTTTAMVSGMAAFYNRVPIGHVEAGLRTRDLHNPFPEEMNRRVIGAMADWHFAPTESAANALLREQADPGRVFTVGNTVIDALRLTMARRVDFGPDLLFNGRRIVLITAHRRESFGAPFESVCFALRELADMHQDVEFVYPVHPNPNVREPAMRRLSGHPRIHLLEPLRYEQFVHLMSRCELILTDSGGIQEEATALGKPTLVMRNTTERPEALSAGIAILVGTDRHSIVQQADQLLRSKSSHRLMASGKCPFGDGYAAQRILDILARTPNCSATAETAYELAHS